MADHLVRPDRERATHARIESGEGHPSRDAGDDDRIIWRHARVRARPGKNGSRADYSLDRTGSKLPARAAQRPAGLEAAGFRAGARWSKDDRSWRSAGSAGAGPCASWDRARPEDRRPALRSVSGARRTNRISAGGNVARNLERPAEPRALLHADLQPRVARLGANPRARSLVRQPGEGPAGLENEITKGGGGARCAG